MHHSVLGVFETNRAPALEQHPMRQCTDLDTKIGPLKRRAQIGDRCTAAPHFADRQLQGSDTILFGAIEVAVEPMPSLLRGGDEGVVQLVPRPQIGDVERPLGAVIVVGTALLVLGPAKVREHVLI